MKRYFLLQCKRALRAFLGMLCVILVLLAGLLITCSTLDRQQIQSGTKFQIALCGTAQDHFLQMGMAALQTFDSTRFAMEIQSMAEPEAAAALARGDIAAYVVIPEGFSEAAAYGNILPLKYVSTTGAAGMVSMVKDEITGVITDIVMESQRCVYGMGNTAQAEGLSHIGQLMTDMAIEYAQFVFVRGNLYQVSVLGIADGLTMGQYLLSGLSVLFLLLACLPFAPLAVKRELALQQMLVPKGIGPAKQIACELGAYLLVYLSVLALAVALVCPWIPEGFTPLGALPAALMAAALSFFLFTLAKDLISGVLGQFVATLALCFVSGCMYPISFFPEPVQALGNVLPAGIARRLMAGCITGSVAWGPVWMLLGCTAVFAAAAIAWRRHALSGR